MARTEHALGLGRSAALLAWAAFWFWAFSFGYSHSFFRYDLGSRLPTFFAAFAGAVALPISAWRQWEHARRGARSPLAAWLAHALCAAASVLPLAAIAGLLARAPEPFHLSGDDAMGVGINFLILIGLAIASALVLAGGLGVGHLRRSRRGDPSDP